MSSLKKYTVTTNSAKDTDLVYDDLVSSRSSSESVPNRSVSVSNERPSNPYNTEYLLTQEEAELLKNDPRVVAVEQLDLLTPVRLAFADWSFAKSDNSTGSKSNWGLIRHIKTGNVYLNSLDTPGYTYDYTLDGTGIDIVVVDSGIQANHPEFNDENGISRVEQINWYTASGVAGTMPSGFYTDYDGHGTHVAATIAGKVFGWAKNAKIYSIKLDGLQGATDPNGGMSIADAMDCILGWNNAKTNGRPTVINNSYGYSVFWHTSQNALSFSSNSGTYYPITGGSYRGSAWVGSARDTAKGHTGSLVSSGIYSFPYRVAAVDADITLLINAGIVVCNAAGNESCKIDVVGGVDYNNYVTATGLSNYYYHRGMSPNCGSGYGFQVGSLGPLTDTVTYTDKKSSFSNSGPGVTVYAAGGNIISAMSQTNVSGSNFNYYLDGNFKQQVLSGTSMASPQVAGISALLLQIHPDWSVGQVYNWLINNSRAQIYSTGLDNDYSNTSSIHGGANRVAYWPLASRVYYTIAVA